MPRVYVTICYCTDSISYCQPGQQSRLCERTFDGYEKHHVDYLADDSISALYSKLHNMYGTCIQPPDVSTRIRDIVRSGSGMVTRINELRNNNTIAHANTQLIQKREAELVIRMLSAIINYIDDIEQTLSTD